MQSGSLPSFLSTSTVQCKMIKERDGVKDLVVTHTNGRVEVGKGRGIHSGGRLWQHKASKWLPSAWTVGAPLLDGADRRALQVRCRHMFCNV